MSSKRAYLVWLKIRLIGVLMILITLPANKLAAQLKSNLPLSTLRQELTVRVDIRQTVWPTWLPQRADDSHRRGTAVGMRNRNGKLLMNNERTTYKLIDFQNKKEPFRSPFTGSWIRNQDKLAILRDKNFNLFSMLNYDKETDKLEFNLQGQVKLSSRISLQIAVFIFHVPRPSFLGAGKLSSVSLYQLQCSVQLQKLK